MFVGCFEKCKTLNQKCLIVVEIINYYHDLVWNALHLLSQQTESITILSLSLITLKKRLGTTGNQADYEWQNDGPIKQKFTPERVEPIKSCVSSTETLESKGWLDSVPGEAVGMGVHQTCGETTGCSPVWLYIPLLFEAFDVQGKAILPLIRSLNFTPSLKSKVNLRELRGLSKDFCVSFGFRQINRLDPWWFYFF